MKNIPFILFLFFQQVVLAQVKILNNVKSSRTNFGVQKILDAVAQNNLGAKNVVIVLDKKDLDKKESFHISIKNSRVHITGNDESGILY
jgi:hypothetical protein